MKKIKIAITGPESCGKTTLAVQLSAALNEPFSSEYARTFLVNLDRKYRQSDLDLIAKAQIENQQKAIENCRKYAIFDTDLSVIKIWSDVVYGDCSDFINTNFEANFADLYLLCAPDMPWEADPLRENPTNRDELFEKYEQLLKDYQLPYVVIAGNQKQRLETVLEILK